VGLPLEQILIQTLNGLVTGMILALIASGLTLIFGIMDVVNFAHGELFMLGAYVGVITLAVSARVYIIEKGIVRHHAAASDLKVDDAVIHQYLGV